MEWSWAGYVRLTESFSAGRGLIESIQQDGSGYRVDRRGIEGLTLFTIGQGVMFWVTTDDGMSYSMSDCLCDLNLFLGL